MHPPRRRGALPALLSLAVLSALAVPLAFPGPDFVPGAGADRPGWLFGITGDGVGVSPGLYLALLIAATLVWLAVVFLAPRLGAGTLAGAILGLVALFALAPPLHSLDVFSYISYGRLSAEGMNPYEFAPVDLPGDDAADRVQDFRGAVSVYGPVFAALSYPLGLVGVPVALWAFKSIAALSVLAIAWVTARLAARRGTDPNAAAAFVALNPLVLAQVLGGAHNDALMMALVMAGVLALSSGRAIGAAGAVVGGVAVKVAGALVVPFAVLGAARRRPLVLYLAGFGAALAAASLAVFGGSVLEAVGVAGGNQETISRYSFPGSISRWLGIDPDVVRIAFAIAYGVGVLWLADRTIRGMDWVRAAGWAATGLLFASAYMAPWYLIWALPLVAVSRDRILVIATVAFSALQLPNALPL